MFHKTLRNPVESAISDSAKGLLVLFVIFGHASNFYTVEPYPFFALKFFHVACFLLFPFIYTWHDFTLSLAANRFVRYYVPFAVFVIFYAFLNLIIFRGGASGFSDWAFDVLKALTLANGAQLDAASGFKALWFLPVYISLVFLLLALPKNYWLLIVAVMAHASAGLVPEPFKHDIPMGLVIALYLVFPGLLIRLYMQRTDAQKRRAHSVMFLIFFMALLNVSYIRETHIKFPVLDLPSIGEPLSLLVHGGIILSAFLFLTTTPLLKKLRALLWCGENSLTLYLTHLPFLAAGVIAAEKLLPARTFPFESLAVIAVFLFSFSGAACCVFILERTPLLKRFLMPRDIHDWPVTRLLQSSKR